ncbi:MAG: sugar ABC transporter ATP-binding protein [bacterium]|nr:sugar ABC transporter ATP-binding protein [bacterium]
MATTADSNSNALVMSDISKAFPGVQALDNANLVVADREIHGLVGENGAGKSTIIKVLAGIYEADHGSVWVANEQLEQLTPQSVHERGVRFIHQELSLVPHFNVTESVFMAQEKQGAFGLATRKMRRQAEDFLANILGAEIDGRTLIRDLTVAQQKLVQIARALIDGQARLVVFDEPTAVLGAADINTLFGNIRELRNSGISIVYVSHYLSEITEICNRVTVFRNGVDVDTIHLGEEQVNGAGNVVSGAANGSVRQAEIIKLMVGREITDMYPESQATPANTVLEVDGLSDGIRFVDASFSVRAGEIVGLTGIIGSGREALVDSIYGQRRVSKGTLAVAGKPIKLRSPAQAVSAGLVLVPRDRRNDGLVLDMSVADNVNVATLEMVSSKLGWHRRQQAAQRADQLVEQLDVRPRRSDTIVRFLSGGNQQKVVLARWLTTDSKVFVLDQPTTGVDVGARSEIYALVAQLAAGGAGVLMSSNDLAEVLGICDRVLVMVRGRIVAERETSGLALDELVALTTGSALEGVGGVAS